MAALGRLSVFATVVNMLDGETDEQCSKRILEALRAAGFRHASTTHINTIEFDGSVSSGPFLTELAGP